MIYNLVKYIKENTSSLTITANGFQAKSPADCLTVSEGSAEELAWFDRKDTQVQIISRATSGVTARENCYTVYNLVKKKYGINLPSVTVSGTVYADVKTYAIRPVNPPQYVADDENGRPQYSFTIDITTIP